MTTTKKQLTPHRDHFTDWMDALLEHGRESLKERENLRKERCEFLRNYFEEDSSRIADLGDNELVRWENNAPILNSQFSAHLLRDERALENLWEEIARRTSYNSHLRCLLGLDP